MTSIQSWLEISSLTQGRATKHGPDLGYAAVNNLGSALNLIHRDHYVHDAQGNVMAIFRYTPSDSNSPIQFEVTDRFIYSSSRLGEDYANRGSYAPYYNPACVTSDGNVRYELTDHLGNIMVTETDDLHAVDTDSDTQPNEYHPVVQSAQGYEPFGSLLPGRNYSSDSYRFGFNGKEKDDELHGATGTSYDFGARLYDPRVGRWLSLDPLAAKYPHNSPMRSAKT